ncbi:hypothetical protein DF186_15855, partial [Enterococcus hirae]
MKTSNRSILICFVLSLLVVAVKCAHISQEQEPFTGTGIEFLGFPFGCSFEEAQKIINQSAMKQFHKKDCDTDFP